MNKSYRPILVLLLIFLAVYSLLWAIDLWRVH